MRPGRAATVFGAAVLLISAMTGCGSTAVPGTPIAVPQAVERTFPTGDPHVVRREGYPDPVDGVGDPGGLVAGPPGPTVFYRGVPVVPACALFPLPELAPLGLRLRGDAPGALRQTRLSGAEIINEPFSLDPANSCTLALPPADGFRGISIAVHQPEYTDPAQIEFTIKNLYDPPEVRNRVLVRPAQRQSNGIRDWLRAGEVHVELTTHLDDERAAKAVLGVVVRRLAEVAVRPVGPSTFGYESPVFTGTHVDACDISRWSDVADLDRGRPDNGFATQVVANGIGTYTLLRAERANYVFSACRVEARQESTDVNVAHLEVETLTFDVESAARDYVTIQRNYVGTVDTAPRAGDESISIPKEHDNDRRTVARKGRVVLRVDHHPGVAVPAQGGEARTEATAAAAMLMRIAS